MPLDACYSLDQTLRLLSIPSPTGYPRQVCGALVETLEGLGFSPRQLRKGGVVCPLGGEGRPLALAAHVDTLGLMVRAVKPDGRLAFTCLGGPSLQAVETENVTVITRGGQRYTGVVELRNASKHVNRELDSEKRDDTTLEILLDEEVSSREDVERLGIAVGDIVCLDPRARVTESGFIRSRFLDDKLSAGMLLTLARGVAEGTVRLSRKVTLFFSVYEEVGHGASCGLPEDTEDLLVVDMGCVGEGLSCREQQVSQRPQGVVCKAGKLAVNKPVQHRAEQPGKQNPGKERRHRHAQLVDHGTHTVPHALQLPAAYGGAQAQGNGDRHDQHKA